MVTQNKEVTVHQETPADMIRFAIEKGADLDKLEKLMNLKREWDKDEAKKAYNVAMTAFKQNPPKIFKDKAVSFGQTKYNHATLGNVAETISTELSKHGLSASWTTKQNGAVEVTCRITHIMGHSEETILSAEADKSGSKNSIQAIGSTITYLERYTLLALTGLATYEQDDDGRASEEVITNKQLNDLRDMLIAKGIEKKEGKLLAILKVESLESLPAKDYEKAVKTIEAAKGAK